MSVDLRGFVYTLEALRQRRRWQRDSLERKLAEAQSRLDECEAESARIGRALDAAARACNPGTLAGFGPSRLQAGLAYLNQLQVLAEETADWGEVLRAARDQARADCVAQHQRCEASDRHRDACLEAYQIDAQRLALAAADNDWVARSGWRKADCAHIEEEST